MVDYRLLARFIQLEIAKRHIKSNTVSFYSRRNIEFTQKVKGTLDTGEEKVYKQPV